MHSTQRSIARQYSPDGDNAKFIEVALASAPLLAMSQLARSAATAATYVHVYMYMYIGRVNSSIYIYVLVHAKSCTVVGIRKRRDRAGRYRAIGPSLYDDPDE